MWENIGNITQLALLHILLYGVQDVFCSNLKKKIVLMLLLKNIISAERYI